MTLAATFPLATSAAVLCLAGVALSAAFAAATLLAFRAQRRRASASPRPGFSPPVTIVKPLEGLDDELEENLESFFLLRYPQYEVVFSLVRPEDPAFLVARRVADRHPGVPATFVFEESERPGNAKVHRLLAGVGRARFAYFLFSDGNVRVEPEFLSRAISFFADPGVGLVSHLFRATGARTFGSRVESLYLNGILRPATAGVARLCGMPCVVGKSILVSRSLWNAIGGLAPLRAFLAEDYLLGRAARGAGYEVVLSADEIETREVSRSCLGAWSRHRRWSILRKRLGGAGFAVEALSSPAGWFLGLLLAVAAGARPGAVLTTAGTALWLARLALEAAGAKRVGPAWRVSDLPLAVVRDVAVSALFVAGVTGARTAWRGRTMRVGRDTRIERDRDASAGAAGWNPIARPIPRAGSVSVARAL